MTTETESLILLIATWKSPRGKRVFLRGPSPPLPLLSLLRERAFFNFLVPKTWTHAFPRHLPLLAFLFAFRTFLPLAQATRNRRIDDDCQRPKINHVFFSIANSKREGRRERASCSGKRQKGRTSGRDSVTHSVDRCRIVYLISGVINQEARPTPKRSASELHPIADNSPSTEWRRTQWRVLGCVRLVTITRSIPKHSAMRICAMTRAKRASFVK